MVTALALIWPMISATSSGSICSFIAVYPDTSLNRTVAWRRSPSVGVSIAVAIDESAPGRATGLDSWWPQWLQNLNRDSRNCPQLGHCICSLAPHSTQNVALRGLSAWHLVHFISLAANPAGCGAVTRVIYPIDGTSAV